MDRLVRHPLPVLCARFESMERVGLAATESGIWSMTQLEFR